MEQKTEIPKQDNIYKNNNEYFIRINKEDVGVRLPNTIAYRAAFNLNASLKSLNIDSQSVSNIHLKKIGDDAHCMDAALDLFGIKRPDENKDENYLYEGYTKAINANSVELLPPTEFSTKSEFLNKLFELKDLPIWIIIENPEVKGIHHIGTYFGIDENGKGIVYEKPNGGIYNPWEVISADDFSANIQPNYKVSFRKPRIL